MDRYTVRRVVSLGPVAAPDVVSVVLWDLPLIKAALRDRFGDLQGPAAEEMRRHMLEDHRSHTQFLLKTETPRERGFEWDRWSVWLEDVRGKTYFPQRIDEESGRIFFRRLPLEALSPFRVVLMNKESLNRVEFPFLVKGRPPGPPPAAPVPVDSIGEMRRHFSRATDFYKNGDYENAIWEWENVLEIDPHHELSKKKIAKARDRLEEERMKNADLSENQKKRQMQIHFLLATEHFKAGDYDDAIREWEEVLKYDPDHQLSKEKIEKAEERLNSLSP